jgi:hypothetical protein
MKKVIEKNKLIREIDKFINSNSRIIVLSVTSKYVFVDTTFVDTTVDANSEKPMCYKIKSLKNFLSQNVTKIPDGSIISRVVKSLDGKVGYIPSYVYINGKAKKI